MILVTSQTSPFGRKARMAALIHGLQDRITVQAGDPWSEGDIVRDVNPLGKMPALVLPEGRAVYDSGVILDYFDTLLATPKLFPRDREMATRVAHALANGLMDAGILITYERLRRPAEYCYEPWIEHQLGKLRRGLGHFCRETPDPRNADAAAITLACALGYFDWRQQIDWRREYPALVVWLDSFRANFPAFDATLAKP